MQTETQRKLAEKEINSSVLISAGCGAIPVSYIDIGATMAVQMRMVKNLCDIYEVKWDEHIAKSLLGSALGNIGKRMGASMLKNIPLIGTVVGGFANAILSGVSTYAMGHAFIKYMQVNSTLKSVADIDAGVFTTMYESFSKQASSVADTIKSRLRWEKEEGEKDESLTTYGERVFGGKEKFHEWLKADNSMIGARPLDLLLSPDKSDPEKVRRLISLYEEGKKAKA